MISQVEKFAIQMQKELDANQHKGDWREWTDIPDMFMEFEYHKGKLLKAIKDNDKPRVKEFIADCANILMFIGNAGQLYDN